MPWNKSDESELVEGRHEELMSVLVSDGWKRVMKPLLVQKCRHIATKLARGKHLEEPKVRALQAQFLLLEEMASKPVDFFGQTIANEAEREQIG